MIEATASDARDAPPLSSLPHVMTMRDHLNMIWEQGKAAREHYARTKALAVVPPGRKSEGADEDQGRMSGLREEELRQSIEAAIHETIEHWGNQNLRSPSILEPSSLALRDCLVAGVPINNPRFGEAGDASDWRRHVGPSVQAIWTSLAPKQRHAIALDALAAATSAS